MSTPARTEVVFRVVGAFDSVEEITEKLGIAPTEAYCKGEVVPRHPERRYPNGYWGLESSPSEDQCLADHLHSLLTILEDKSDSIRELQESGHQCDLFCGVFTEDECEVAIELEPGMLSRIGCLGISLDIRTYAGSHG